MRTAALAGKARPGPGRGPRGWPGRAGQSADGPPAGPRGARRSSRVHPTRAPPPDCCRRFLWLQPTRPAPPRCRPWQWQCSAPRPATVSLEPHPPAWGRLHPLGSADATPRRGYTAGAPRLHRPSASLRARLWHGSRRCLCQPARRLAFISARSCGASLAARRTAHIAPRVFPPLPPSFSWMAKHSLVTYTLAKTYKVFEILRTL